MTTPTLVQPVNLGRVRREHFRATGVSLFFFVMFAFHCHNNGMLYTSAIWFAVIGAVTGLVHLAIVGSYRRSGKPTKWDRRALGLFPLFILVSLLPVLVLGGTGWKRVAGSEQEIVECGDQLKLRIKGPRPAGDVNQTTITKVEFLNPIDPTNHIDFGVNLPETYARSSEYLVLVSIPASRQWTGESIELRIEIQSAEVDKQGTKSKNVADAEVSIPVSPKGSFEIYQSLWWVALLAGVVPMLLLGFALSRAHLAVRENL